MKRVTRNERQQFDFGGPEPSPKPFEVNICVQIIDIDLGFRTDSRWITEAGPLLNQAVVKNCN